MKKQYAVLKSALAVTMTLSCITYTNLRVMAVDDPIVDTNNQNEVIYAKVTSITQNPDNTVTITLDKKIDSSRMSGSNPGSRWIYDGDLSLTSNEISATGEFFVDVILEDVDGEATHHNLYRNSEGEWSVVVEYRYNQDFLNINPQLFIQIGNELVEIENYREYAYMGQQYVVEETFTATPKIVVVGHDLDDIETYLQRHADTKNIYEPTGDHTTTVGYLENEGKTVSGIYTVVIDHNVNGSIFMPNIQIKYEEVDRTALNEKIAGAQEISGTGYTEESYAALQFEINNAKSVSDSNTSTEEEVNTALNNLQSAIDDLKVEVVRPEILSAVEEDGQIKLELSAKPEGYGSVIRPATGYGEYFSYREEDGKVYAVSLDFPEGEVYTVVTFELSQADEDGNLYVNYWLYRDAEGNITYGEVPPISETPDPTVTITVGNKTYDLKKSGSGVTTIEVGVNDKATVSVEGVDLQKIRYTDSAYEYVDVAVDGNHQTKTFTLVDNTGVLTSGFYTFEVTNPSVSSTSLRDNKGNYHSYDVKIVVLEVDKTELQKLYDNVKDSENTNSFYKYFEQELEKSKSVLDDPNATQDQVDMRVDQLSAKYYTLLVAEFNSTYSPTNGTEDLMKYTTDSLKPVINMWGITHNRTNNNYEENSIIGNVGQMKGWYEEYIKAVEGLEEATLEDHYIGLYEEVTSTKKYQGHFEVVKEEVVEVNGEKKIRLTVQFINDGLHPVYGEELPNANGSTKFEDFSIDRDGDNIHAKVKTYNEELKQQRYTDLANITPLDGNTNYYDGFQGTIDLNPTDKYVTFDFYASSNSYKTYSPWYYRVSERDLTAPNATVTTSNNGAPTNQSVTVTITADEPIQEVEGWTLNEDGMTLTKVFDENTTGTLTITDLAGNETKVSYTVSGIDKKAPEIIKIVPNSDGTVTVKFDEPVTIEADEWKESEAAYEQGGQFWVGTLTENKFYDVTAKDAAGNTVEFRVDHEKPELTVSYSITDPTNKDVTVTVKSDEPIDSTRLPEGWTLSEDGLTATKKYDENRNETVIFADKLGNTSEVQISVDNIDKTNPIIELTEKNVVICEGDEFDPMDLVVSVTDGQTDLSQSLVIIEEPEIDTDKIGTYVITYQVEDAAGNVTKEIVTLTVNPKMAEINAIPVITANDQTIKVNDTFDVLANVSATDKEDGDLTNNIKVIANDVDTTKPGIYHVTYQVSDSTGGTSTKTITVTVADNTLPTDPEEPSTPDEPDTGEEKPGDTTETPSTSDSSMMSVYVGLLTVSAWMLAVLLRRKREAK